MKQLVVIAAVVLGIVVLVIYMNQRNDRYIHDGKAEIYRMCNQEYADWGHYVSDICKR